MKVYLQYLPFRRRQINVTGDLLIKKSVESLEMFSNYLGVLISHIVIVYKLSRKEGVKCILVKNPN